MTKITLFLLLVLISSCADAPLFNRVTEDYPDDWEKIPVKDRLEAKKAMLKEYNFLKLLFVESRDPYYGTPKWGEKCLADNTFEYKEENGMIALKTNLYIDSSRKPGFCSGKAEYFRSNELMLYCGDAHFYWKIRFPQDKNYPLSSEVLCP